MTDKEKQLYSIMAESAARYRRRVLALENQISEPFDYQPHGHGNGGKHQDVETPSLDTPFDPGVPYNIGYR